MRDWYQHIVFEFELVPVFVYMSIVWLSWTSRVSLVGVASTRANLGSSPPGHQLLHPVSGSSLCGHGPL